MKVKQTNLEKNLFLLYEGAIMQKQVKKIKIRVFEIINKAETGDWASRAFDIVIMSLIALSIISIVLESFASLKDKYHYVFQTFEYVSVAVFTLEYAFLSWLLLIFWRFSLSIFLLCQ